MHDPVLETERFRLLVPAHGHRDSLVRLFADPAVHAHLSLGPMNALRANRFAETFINDNRHAHATLGDGLRIISPIAKDWPPTVGYCGLRRLPESAGLWELSYATVPSHQGQGVATEAARAVLTHGFGSGRLRCANAFVRSGNGASVRVLKKLGARHEGESARYYGETLQVYAIDRAGFEGAGDVAGGPAG
jgi:RimJ/RimL family protein N-acetyltransferase